MPSFSIYHSFRFFGRSANITASLPYAVGNFTGELFNQERSVYRSGLLDFGARFSVNLYGGRELPQFAKWKQKVLLGASLRVVAPTGQYDPTKLINWASIRMNALEAADLLNDRVLRFFEEYEISLLLVLAESRHANLT